MKNKDRFPAPYVLAQRTNGTVSVSGLSVGQSGGADGAVVCVKTNGGAVVAVAAPNATTYTAAANNNSNENTSGSSD